MEGAIRVHRQVDYFLSVAHLENDAHARNLFKSNGMVFYVKDFMSWPRAAGITEREIVSVCVSLRNDDRYMYDDVCVYVSDDSTEWEDLTDEEKATADLKDAFVMSDPCRCYVESSEASTKTEL